MNRRTPLKLILIFVLLLVATILIWLSGLESRPTTAINHANFDQVQIGMTEAEVEAVFGCPSGLYNTKDVGGIHFSGIAHRRWWISDDAIITIELGPSNCVSSEVSSWVVQNKTFRRPRPLSYFWLWWHVHLPSWLHQSVYVHTPKTNAHDGRTSERCSKLLGGVVALSLPLALLITNDRSAE